MEETKRIKKRWEHSIRRRTRDTRLEQRLWSSSRGRARLTGVRECRGEGRRYRGAIMQV